METDATSPEPAPASEATFLARHALPLSLALLSLATMIGGRGLGEWLRYDRTGILHGEIWRLASGHIVHLGWQHLALNLAGLALVWMLYGRVYSLAQWLFILASSMLGVSLGLLLFLPAIHWYVGLSGVLHGLFVAGALASLLAGFRAELLLLGLLAVKLVWEHFQGALPGSESLAGGTVLIEAHLYGAITGVLAAAILLIYRRRSGKPQQA
jgi:rhomboid family GlyGly-CTERM serine protease